MHTYNSCQLSSKELIGMVNIGKVWVHKIHEKLRLLKYREVEKIEILSSNDSVNLPSESDVEDLKDINLVDNSKMIKSSYDNKSHSNARSINVFNLKI